MLVIASVSRWMAPCVLAALACSPEPKPRPATAIDVGAPDASSAPDDGTDPAGMVGASSPDGGSPHPPTGMYEVTARVVADDCKRGYQPPEPWTVVVQAGAEPGVAKVNVPLAAIPPSNATHASSRSDIRIQPRRAFQSTITPMPACPSYTTTQSFELVDAGPQGFRFVVKVDHGEGKMCSSYPPSNCTTTVEYAYKLVRSLCAAECTRGIVLTRDAGVDVDCRCP